MKHFLSLSFVIALAGALCLLSSCGSEEPKPDAIESDEVKAILTSATWKIQGVNVDGVDKTSVYKDLTLKFTETTFTTTHGGPVWPESGTWSFADNTGKQISRSDAVNLTVVEATASRLALKLTWNKTTLGSGRTQSVSGEHTFTFAK